MSNHEGFVITCPHCGKVVSRSIMTESKIHCDRCKADFYTYLKDGVLITAGSTVTASIKNPRIAVYAENLLKALTGV